MWGLSQGGRTTKTIVAAGIIIALIAMISGCSKDDRVLAQYAGGQITQSQFDAHIASLMFLSQQTEANDDEQFQLNMLHQLIAMKIIAADADKEVARKEEQAAKEEFTLMKEQFMLSSSSADWRAILKEYNIKEKDVIDFLVLSRVVGEVLDRSLDEADIEAEYEKLKQDNVFDMIDSSHILVAIDEFTSEGIKEIRTMDEALDIANDILAKLAQGEDFATLAKTYSDDDETAADGGALPEMSGAQLSQFFGQDVLDLEVGDVSDPIAMEHGYHIIKINDKYTEQLEDLDDATMRQLRGYVVSVKFLDFVENSLPDIIEQINL